MLNFLESLLIGFSIAAIPGPIFFELIRRTLSHGLRSGVLLVFGEFIGNFLLLSLIFFGISNALTNTIFTKFLYIFGGIILLFISTLALKLKEAEVEKSYDNNKNIKNNSFIAGLLISITSPIVIAFWVSISGSYLSEFDNNIHAFINIFLIAIGFLLFFLPLSFIVFKIRHKIPPNKVVILSKIFGLILIFYGLLLISKAL